MGLYIPDVRLPADNDFELWIAVKKDGSFTYNVRGGWQDGKQKAVSVLESHGDLIDRDKLRAKEFIHDGDAYAVVMSRDIRNVPAVIPASKEG